MSKTFDFSVPPFDRLTPAERDKVTAGTDIVYLRPGDQPIRPGAPVDHLYVVLKGLLAEKAGDEVITVHGKGDHVGATALLHGREPVLCEVQEEALAHIIPKQLVLDLCRANPDFEAFFTQSVADRLAARAMAESTRGMASFMVSKVGQSYLHPPIEVDGATTLRDAALRMKAEKVTSLLVRRDDGAVGVLTGTDLRDAALIEGLPADAPVADSATYALLCVDEDEFLFNAQVLMTRHGVRRLPVLRAGTIIGILELTDLLSSMSSHSTVVATQIDRATTIDDLRAASQSLGPLLQGLHGSGVKIRFIAEMVSDLSRKIQRRLFEFIVPADLRLRCCLVVMGSEGRGEQIARTDQDNALILADDVDPAAMRPIAEAFTRALLDFGYPPCPGGMMVSNPAWTRTESDFRDEIRRWIVRPDETTFLNLAAFIDGEAVAGDPLLLARLRATLFDRLTDSQGFLAHFARPVLAFDTPIGFFHQILVEKGAHKGEIDIKKGGIFPIVHGSRALALEKHLHVANTFARIDALRDAGLLDREFAADLQEALAFLLEMRLHARLRKGALDGVEADTYVRADSLSKLQHDALKDSLLIVKQFKDVVSHHFRLGAF
ncbi:putative nucleotidyltransferase substrate binding domain-containing protein [Novispirillum sp. DQ9]|uniref:putative nucleotidyltransferase substrate binding domain-containing protein n=1 Tax=Novispirillum sp. DQ9 TaxID=3398612 RepID=UPI003C7C724D